MSTLVKGGAVVCTISVLAFLSFGCQHKPAAASLQNPNIIFILADDMGYGDVRFLNKDAQVQTPNLDKLAREGIAFTDAHSGAAVCTPTRYGLLTGRYAFRSSLKNGVLGGYASPLIEPDRVTLADILKNAGYQTAIIGKWHLGLHWPAKDTTRPAAIQLANYSAITDNTDWKGEIIGPNELGFDYSYIISASLDMPPYAFIENGRMTDPNFTKKLTSSKQPRGNMWRAGDIASDFRLERTLDDLIQKSQQYLRDASKNENPFFLYLPLTSPHTPWLPGKTYHGKSGAGTYGDFVEHTDAAVGKILKTIDSLNISDNTLIIFSSDNGADWKPEDKATYPLHKSNYIYRGGKSDVWEGGHRVPFLVRWPARITPGEMASQTICLTDLVATVADLTNQTLASGAGPDSFSFLPILDNPNAKPLRQSTIHHSVDGTFAIRKEKWKFVDSNGSGGWAMKTEEATPEAGQLYDMEANPEETTNLYREYPEIVHQLKALLEKQKSQGFSRAATGTDTE